MESPELNSKLLECAQKYFLAIEQHDDATKEALSRDICALLERPLDALLHTNDRWNPCDWVDAVYADSVVIPMPTILEVTGTALWGKNGNEWIDPFFARMELSTSGAIPSYTLCFGNAQIGVGKVPFGAKARDRDRLFPVKNWAYTFNK